MLEKTKTILLAQLHKQAQEVNSFSWLSEVITSNKVITDPLEAIRISNLAFESKTLQKEIAQAIENMGGVSSPALWDAYFKRAYNTVAASSDSYLRTVSMLTNDLPKKGHIIDFGSGPGNFAFAIAKDSSERSVTGLDMSPHAIESAKKLLEQQPQSINSRVNFQVGNLLELSPETFQADGGMMNNVLYNMKSKKEKVTLLTKVKNQLKPGAIFILNDPLPRAKKKLVLKKWLAKLAKESTENGSPLTAFDIAFLSEMNRAQLVGSNIAFSTSAQLIRIAEQAGFEVVRKARSTYDDIATSLVLRVPIN